MKPIATSTSDFADLITSGGIYVDKTGYFHRLVSNRLNKFLFFARPRRFGKSLMKDCTGAIRFLMMTGVSKFTKMSVFSGLNNIVDISMDEEYATISSVFPSILKPATSSMLWQSRIDGDKSTRWQ